VTSFASHKVDINRFARTGRKRSRPTSLFSQKVSLAEVTACQSTTPARVTNFDELVASRPVTRSANVNLSTLTVLEPVPDFGILTIPDLVA
jgi:hypothetical protein